MDEKQKVIEKYVKENSESELLDRMKALGLSQTDINALKRLPINHESLSKIVDNLIYEKSELFNTVKSFN